MEQLEPGVPKARPTLTACLNGPQDLRRRVLDAIDDDVSHSVEHRTRVAPRAAPSWLGLVFFDPVLRGNDGAEDAHVPDAGQVAERLVHPCHAEAGLIMRDDRRRSSWTIAMDQRSQARSYTAKFVTSAGRAGPVGEVEQQAVRPLVPGAQLKDRRNVVGCEISRGGNVNVATVFICLNVKGHVSART